MDPSPYESPRGHDNPRARWRVFWKRTCIASLCIAAICFLAGKALAMAASDANDAAWFLIVDGLIALVELGCLTLAGLSGIGWAISRRPSPNNEPTESSD